MKNNITDICFALEEVYLQYGTQKIFDNISFTVHKNEKIGIVGRNGAGKSSLLKAIAKYDVCDSGEIVYKRGVTAGYLSQEFTLDETTDVYHNILDGVKHITDLLFEYENLPADSKKSWELENQLRELDAWALESNIDSIMSALDVPSRETSVANLSGGEKRRVALAKTLIAHPDLLLLDEPTNHLDVEAIEWLESFIANYKGTCLFVTHDRYFLDNLTSKIIEISNAQVYHYNGNYSYFLEKKADRIANESALEDKRQKFLRREVEWIRRGPKARTTKAQYRVDKFYDIANQDAPELEQDVELIIPPPVRLGNKVVSLQNLSVIYGDNVVIDNFSYEFEPGSKIGIVGPNGSGKTSLLKSVINQNPNATGVINISDNVEFNYIDQERVALNEENTVVEEIGEGNNFIMLGDEKISIWGYLKRFLFSDERIKTIIKYLSGGEKARLLLAKVLKTGGNFIILDEPTNDLDLPTLQLLESAIAYFPGVLLVVSHDRYFLNKVCTGILSLEKDGKIDYTFGNYNDYIEKRKKPAQVAKVDKKEVEKKTKAKKLTWKEKKELEGMEENILVLEERLEEVQNMFSAEDFFEKHGNETESLTNELNELKLKIEKAYERWEILEKKAENI